MDSKFSNIISDNNTDNININNDPIIYDSEDIKQIIKNINKNINRLEKQYQIVISQVNTCLIEKENNIFIKLTSETQNMMSSVKSKLDNLHEIFMNMEECIKKVMLENTHTSLIKELSEVLMRFGNINGKYKEHNDKKIKREIKIINPNFNDNEINNMIIKIEIHGMNNLIFANTFISEEHSRARENLRYYKEMYKDIKELEKQFSQIKQMFIDLSVFVSYQGDLINNIQHNVDKSKKYIVKGNKQLEQAIKRSQKSCCVF